MENKNNLKDFLKDNNIEIIDDVKKFSFHNPAEKHIENIIKFHRRVREYENCFQLGLRNSAGKETFNYRLWLKRAKFLKKELEIEDSEFDDLINKAEISITLMEKSNYIELINRASKRREIVLGNCSNDNIYFKEEKLFVREINKIEFNMVENDCIRYIQKEKKKRKQVNFNKIIALFLEGEGLGEESYNYIYAMVTYPKESMKYISECYLNNLKDFKVIKEKLKTLKNIDYIGIS
ncbi:MAG: hypothetical protein ACRDD2_11735 [Sarcina sp.]